MNNNTYCNQKKYLNIPWNGNNNNNNNKLQQ